MDKCWFVLPQTHYPPPQEDEENGKQTGPICLGHFIQDLEHLDQVINESGPEPFSLEMPIYRTQPIGFEWENNREGGIDLSVSADAPVAAGAGVTAKASMGFALKKTVRDYWQFDQLDTMVVQPSRAYINRCLATPQIAEFLQQKKLLSTWSIYIITGLKIVRGSSTRQTSYGRERGLRGGTGVGVAGIAETSIDGNITSGNTTSISAQYTNDFVWAIRLSKITKGLFDKRWTQKAFSKGATFSMDEQHEGVERILADEGLKPREILDLELDDEVLVI